jgi:hypothetical protein
MILRLPAGYLSRLDGSHLFGIRPMGLPVLDRKGRWFSPSLEQLIPLPPPPASRKKGIQGDGAGGFPILGPRRTFFHGKGPVWMELGKGILIWRATQS